MYVNLVGTVAGSRITPKMIIGCVRKGIAVKRSLGHRRDEVDAAGQGVLDAHNTQLGRSLVVGLWQRLILDRMDGAPAPMIEADFGKFLPQKKLAELLELQDRGVREFGRPAFPRARATRPIFWPIQFRSAHWFRKIVRAGLLALHWDGENIVRAGSSIPAVGEEWVPEVALLNEVRAAFPAHRVDHQSRPAWLGQQSLDVYFPDENIGVECQGAQPWARSSSSAELPHSQSSWEGMPGNAGSASRTRAFSSKCSRATSSTK